MRRNHWHTLWTEAHHAFHRFRAPKNSEKPKLLFKRAPSLRERARRVTHLASKGYYRRALQAAHDQERADTRDDAVLAQLKGLHPQRQMPLTPKRNESLPRSIVTESQVYRALTRMDTTSSAGTDAMSVRLLRLLLLDVALVGLNETGITVLTKFDYMAPKGRLPPTAYQLLASARLVAISKGRGRIRPVAVGNVLRRLIAKCAMPMETDECRRYLQPHQFANATLCGLYPWSTTQGR